MPPPGGYAPIKWARVGQKTVMNGYILTGLYCASLAYGFVRYRNWKQYLKKLEVEKFDSFVAMEPFINAERDRQ
jgi:ribosomal protein L33